MKAILGLWRAINARVGKVQQAILIGAVATAIVVPIAVASPQGSPNLQTTPTTTSSTSTSTTSTATSSTTSTSTSVTTTAVTAVTTTVVAGTSTVVLNISSGVQATSQLAISASVSNGTTTITLTATGNGSFTVSGTVQGCGLTPGVHTVTGVTTTGQTVTGTVTVIGTCGTAAATGGTTLFGPMEQAGTQTWIFSSNLQGTSLKTVSIVSAVSGVPSQVPPAQVPVTTAKPLPAQLPHTGAGGMAQS